MPHPATTFYTCTPILVRPSSRTGPAMCSGSLWSLSVTNVRTSGMTLFVNLQQGSPSLRSAENHIRTELRPRSTLSPVQQTTHPLPTSLSTHTKSPISSSTCRLHHLLRHSRTKSLAHTTRASSPQTCPAKFTATHLFQSSARPVPLN